MKSHNENTPSPEERLQLREDISNFKKLLALAETRLHELETRIEPVENAIAKIPSIEARLGRVDKMLLELQFSMRRFENAASTHNKTIEGKLDGLRELFVASLQTEPPK